MKQCEFPVRMPMPTSKRRFCLPMWLTIWVLGSVVSLAQAQSQPTAADSGQETALGDSDAAAGRAFARQMADQAAKDGSAVERGTVARSASVLHLHPVILLLFLAGAAAWLYRSAALAQRGLAIRLASAFLGMITLTVSARFVEEWFGIMVPVAADGSWSTPLGVYLALLAAPVIGVMVLGLTVRHALSYWRFLGGHLARTAAPPRTPMSRETRRTIGYSLLGLSFLITVFRFVFLETLYRPRVDIDISGPGLRGALEQIDALNTLVNIQATLDGVAALLALGGLLVVWRSRPGSRAV